MNAPPPPPSPPPANAATHGAEPASAAPVRHLQLKALALLLALVVLVAASVVYLLFARGVFEPTQRLVLVADDSEGVVVGMDLTFSGFAIGRVRRIELADEGNARIVVDVPKKDAHWLRTSSVFTLVRGVLGGTNIRAYSGVLSDPPLPDGAQRPVLRGDASADVSRTMNAAKELIDNISALTAKDAALSVSLSNLQAFSEKLNGPRGAMGALLGSEAEVRKVSQALERANSLLARLDALAARADGVVARADQQLLGADGLTQEAKQSLTQLTALLTEARGSLKKADALLVDAQAVAANAREATTDLGALRAEVEATLRKLEGLVNEINRKWPFARNANQTQIKLP